MSGLVRIDRREMESLVGGLIPARSPQSSEVCLQGGTWALIPTPYPLRLPLVSKSHTGFVDVKRHLTSSSSASATIWAVVVVTPKGCCFCFPLLGCLVCTNVLQ